MSNLEKRTILLNSIFSFGSSLMSNFVSVYLFIYTKSIPMMCLYIIIRIGLFPVFFILGNKISKKHPFTLTYILSLIIITGGLIFALLGGPLFEKNPYYVLIAPVIIGSGEGLYYFSANTCNQIISSIETRANFLSYNGAITTLTALFSTIFASVLLATSKTEMTGYRIMLAVIVCVFVVVIFIAASINKRTEDNDARLRNSLIPRDRQWKDHQLAVFIYGLRDGLGLNTIGLLVYQAAGSGGLYSKLQTLFSLCSAVVYFLSKKLLNRKRIEKSFIIGVILKMASTYSLIFFPNVPGAIFYGVVNALAASLYDNSYNFLSANIISKYPSEMTSRVVAREVYLSAGRVTSMCIVLLCYKLLPGNMYLTVSVSLLTLAPILVEKILIRYK